MFCRQVSLRIGQTDRIQCWRAQHFLFKGSTFHFQTRKFIDDSFEINFFNVQHFFLCPASRFGPEGSFGAQFIAAQIKVPLPEHGGHLRSRIDERTPPAAVAGHRWNTARLVRRLLERQWPLSTHRGRQVGGNLFWNLKNLKINF